MRRRKSPSKMVQINKQVTVVNVKCPPVKRRRRCHVTKHSERCTECVHVCGRILQRCDKGPRVYFRAIDTLPSAIIRIDNRSECTMTAVIEVDCGENVVGTIGQGQQVSFDVSSLRALIIDCHRCDGICKGFYEITLSRTCRRF